MEGLLLRLAVALLEGLAKALRVSEEQEESLGLGELLRLREGLRVMDVQGEELAEGHAESVKLRLCVTESVLVALGELEEERHTEGVALGHTVGLLLRVTVTEEERDRVPPLVQTAVSDSTDFDIDAYRLKSELANENEDGD